MADLHWSKPPNVAARRYDDWNKPTRFGASDDLTGWRNPNFRNTPIFMLWAHCVGQLPPINCIELLAQADPTPELTTLMDAYACFQGVERPHLKEDNGENVLVYLLKPKVSIEWKADMACVARAVSPKRPFILMVQVVLKDALQDGCEGVEGLITRIEPVACDMDDDTLPVAHETRFRRRCW